MSNSPGGLLRGETVVSKLILCMTAALLLACASCANKDNIYPVSGKVTYQGSPASGAAVFFYRQGGDATTEPPIMGIVQQDGSFELICGSLGRGAPPGNYDVLIEWKRVAGKGRRRPQTGPDKLKGRYADRQHPLLYATVEPRATNLAPFELTDAAPGQKR
jgi:hypothetical protein